MEALLRRVGLAEDRQTRVANLSFGAQRRLQVAIAFVGNHDLVVLDAPTTSVDPGDFD